MADQLKSSDDHEGTEKDSLFSRSALRSAPGQGQASSSSRGTGDNHLTPAYPSFDIPSILQGIDRNLHSYDMSHAKRGKAVIFNHEDFHPNTQMPRRRGTHHDVNNLKKQLTRLQFDVIVHQDLTVVQLWDAITYVSSESHENSDCFICVFLTHGDNDIIYAHDGVLKLQDLFDRFRGERCKSLVGKPKIFLIQACRGEEHETGIDAMDGVKDIDVADAGPRPTVPCGADFLLAYSVVQGFYSHRDTGFGSWFIQALTFVMERYGTTMEFTDMLLLVNHIVSQRSVQMCSDPSMIGKKQIPCFISILTKKLYFNPK